MWCLRWLFQENSCCCFCCSVSVVCRSCISSSYSNLAFFRGESRVPSEFKKRICEFVYYLDIKRLPWQRNIQWKTPFILALAAYNSKMKSLTPTLYCWKIISMLPLNLMQILKKILGRRFRAILIFQNFFITNVTFISKSSPNH